ncbi:CCHC-type domain-containing protein [Trichonephila inaurata madagascariensis]|uniref:CCHC-type domain-containing protein n=1 Tax=Trichonephila inaurata madagascariensis TaxID=2747483 RepID=A0A8X6XZU4_9ARAC|nr:CCHC-type domain-containing protein [Trichonephila inaurata madagascariensis]
MGGINMPEDQKISHLMKKVAEDFYQVLINSEVTMVYKFVTCCRKVDSMRKKRVLPLRYEKQPNVTLISTAMNEDLSDLIQMIVKEEIEKVLPRIVTCINYGPSYLEPIIREEVRRQARQRRQLHKYERWDFDSVSDYSRDPESNYQRYRSNSPYTRRNPQLHQSRSLSRHSPVRTSEEN